MRTKIKEIVVAYYHFQKLPNLYYEHNEVFGVYNGEYHDTLHDIIDTVLRAGYNLQIIKAETRIIVWVDNKNFKQR